MSKSFSGLRKKWESILGNLFLKMSIVTGTIASHYLMRAQWSYGSPTWFDHRHHLLNPKKYFTDFWTTSADNVLRTLPLNGRLLDLCAGDGFYDYYFYRRRAAEILCVEFDQEAYQQSIKLHRAPNINYIYQDVLSYEPRRDYFDVVVIRGAIEQFDQQDQQLIFQKAAVALKPDGWFCGDTPANVKSNDKLLPVNKREYANEGELLASLQKVFPHVETFSIRSADRTSLYWKCRK